MGVGAMVRRRRVLNEQADRTLLDLSVHLLLPCLILDHLMSSEALRIPGNLLWSPCLGFVCTAGSIGVAALAARWWGFERTAQARTFAFVAGIYNYGYIPVPLIAALYGANAIGVLLGVSMMWLVFERFYPRPAADEMVRVFIRTLRLMAALVS